MNATTTATDETPPHGWRPTPLVAGSMGLHALAGMGLVVQPEWWAWLAGAVAGDHVLMGAVGLWPRSTWLGPNVRRLPAASIARGEIALTFDDGPDPDVTPRVLARLAERGAHASFFCVGHHVREHGALCAEVARQGHAVENHSGRHRPTFAMLGLARLRRDLEEAQATISAATGITPCFFRAPAGLRSPLLDPVLHATRLRLVSWTRRGFDTRLQPRDVVARLTRGLRAGDILVLHDRGSALTRNGTPGVLEALPRVLDAIGAAGLTPVTLREAFGA
jgi:peptidoglycan/xylan/chitin deacetylase (PgdA/CDA1 family)